MPCWCRIFCVLSLLLLTNLPSRAEDFVGNWFNVDAETDGITRIEIRQRPNGLEIHPFGRCQPTECDWGWSPAELFISHATWQPAALLVEYRTRSDRIVTTLTLHHEQGLLRVDSFTRFADERKPYWAVYRFKGKDPLASRPVPAAPVSRPKR